MCAKFSKKLKIFLISALVLLVAGMTIFGVFGLNQTLDNKKSYEMKISVDQVVGDSVDVLKTSADEALVNIYGSANTAFYQEMNAGSVLIYKFSEDVTENVAAIKEYIQNKLDNSSVSGVNAEVKVYENSGDYDAQAVMAIVAISIAVVVIFAYALIMNKVAGGLAVLCASILAVLLFTALMALTRIPAQPYFAILASAVAAISSALALVITSRYKALSKAKDKASKMEIAQETHASLFKVFIALVAGVLLAAIIAGATAGLTSIYIGLAILVAGVSGVASAVYMTPIIWSLIKGKKK